MSLQRRIAALEKKRLAAADDRILGIIDYCDSQGFPEWDGVHRKGQQVIGVIGGIRIPPEEFAERCRNQQADLMNRLAAYEAELTESEEGTVQHGKDTSPASVGFNDQLAPGAKPLKFRYETDASGTEWQIEVSTGQKWKV